MPVLGRPGTCVLDLPGPGELAIELLAGADAADRPLPDASADEHAAPAPRHRSEELLMMDGLELRQSRTRASAHLAAPQHREALACAVSSRACQADSAAPQPTTC